MSQLQTEERAVKRLVRSYPRQWRARYGEEFKQLLLDEAADGELSLARKLDVLGHGMWTRLAYAGLAGSALEPKRRLRSLLVAMVVMPSVFVVLAVAVWAQLTIGWQWSTSVSPGTTAAMWLMSIGLIGLGGLAVLVVALCAVQVARAARRRRGGDHWRAVAVWLVACTVLYVGAHHFGPHWPGTGGHAARGAGFMPGWMARLSWAGTLWVSSYWAHPAALGSFPAGELVWMVVSPVAWIALIGSGAVTVHRLDLPPKLRRPATLLCGGAATGMMVFLAGAVLWVCSDNSGPQGLLAAGAIDFVIVAMLSAALVATTHLVRRIAAQATSTLAR